ncbi:class I SAM-dependent rRNA methyltransferase [Cohnella ginsengisoli]|uniref:Class I SAM-dependent rRNA methyltransferase n=1 Tax=Cohnella ginsengisoli TaxID=425004 RepID=A0A9X4KKR2_9BACL|nr:class I SAM-dependent rRNA methyltransferase [Cohnella ginsengisoli]MDG0793209.1 class I SAM-dependent rRNA methyltransferase [Cohnella ginsengisoli]
MPTDNKPFAVLNRSRRPRLELGHPWIFANEIERTEGEPEAGGLLEVRDHRGQFLATGYWNPASQISIRIVAYGTLDAMDEAFFEARFRACLDYRERFAPGDESCRLVFGEADFLPGLVVDRFDGVLVVQVLTLGMDKAREAWLPALVRVFAPKGVYERSDVGVRTLEGLEERTGVLYGDCPRYLRIVENGLSVQVDIEGGQKTGYFFDQRENRAAIEPLMKGWGKRSGISVEERATEEGVRPVPVNANGSVVTFPYWDGATVLECFAHTGSFTLHACKYGAKRVTCLDISEHGIDTARTNVATNGFEDRVEFVVADAFEYLREQVKGREERAARAGAGAEGAAKAGKAAAKVDTSKPLTKQGRTWDVIILDPPAFAKTKRAVPGAIRGYKDINLQAMKLINEGGYLVTASCSYHVRPELFMETLLEAARDAGKVLRRIVWTGAGRDHPQLVGVEEGHYLKFGIFEVRSRKEL